MGVERMTGTPWHTEKMCRTEGDGKRHKSKCKYYVKVENHCSKCVSRCIGSAHCSYYVELSSEDIAKRVKTNTAKRGPKEDTYWF